MNWSLRVGSFLVVGLAVVSLLPTPLDPVTQVDPVSSRYRPPGTTLQEIFLRDGRHLLADSVDEDGDALVVVRRGTAQTVKKEQVLNWQGGAIANRRTYILGTDKFGRDIWSRMMVGARVSLTIALLSVALSFTIGTVVGATAATASPGVDNLIMRAVDATMAFPPMFLVLAAAAIIGPGTVQVILLLGLTSWMTCSRLTRAELLSLKQRDFVLASRSTGQTPIRIVLRHLLPNALSPLVVDATLQVGGLILAEAALSFFGLGVQAPTPSWGNMIADGRTSLDESWWVALFPGIAIALTVIGFNLLGDGLRDCLDPQRESAATTVEQSTSVL